jgi:hypothetical protein
MRSRLFLAPWWVNALVIGVFFGTFMAGFSALEDDEGWLTVVVFGTISGILFGAAMGWWGRREQSRWRKAAGLDLDDEQLLVVHRAMTNGPVPSDPRLRLAAFHAATYEQERIGGPWASVVFLLAIPVLVVLRIVDSWWWLVLVPLYLYGAYETWAQPRRLRARIALLSSDQPAA